MNTRFMRRTTHGFTFVDLLVILLVIFLLAAVMLPALANLKSKSARIACTDNLKALGLAFRTWAVDSTDEFPMSKSTNVGGTRELVSANDAFRHFLAMTNELGKPAILYCPFDKARVAATNWASLRSRNISYFVGLEAKETEPLLLLSGDSNLTTNGVPVRPGLLALTRNLSLGWTDERHATNNGNIVFGDGSVQQWTSARMGRYLATTNRLLVP